MMEWLFTMMNRFEKELGKYLKFANINNNELAHCKSDFVRAQKGSLISLTDNEETDDYELRADKQAYSWMVDDATYNQIKEDYINIDNYKDVKSFIVYRLAHDGITKYSSSMYQKYNDLLKLV